MRTRLASAAAALLVNNNRISAAVTMTISKGAPRIFGEPRSRNKMFNSEFATTPVAALAGGDLEIQRPAAQA